MSATIRRRRVEAREQPTRAGTRYEPLRENRDPAYLNRRQRREERRQRNSDDEPVEQPGSAR
jgi:hypothetical protein